MIRSGDVRNRILIQIICIALLLMIQSKLQAQKPKKRSKSTIMLDFGAFGSLVSASASLIGS